MRTGYRLSWRCGLSDQHGAQRIGVLAGGPSSEREISLKSGRAVYEAIKTDYPAVTLIGIESSDNGYTRSLIENERLDCAFLALHGRFGEDGTIQGILDDMHVPYTGSGAAASRIAFDKAEARDVFKKRGVPVPEASVLKDHARLNDIDISYPVIVKPSEEGSSIGLSFVRGADDLEAAVQKAFTYSGRVIVERYISGRDITVSVLDGKALPVVEIRPKNFLYDFAAKYNDNETLYIVPAQIGRDLFVKAQEIGVTAHKALGCEGFSRVDMRLSESGEIFVLEVNTIPGLTERSLFPKAAQAVGMDFRRLCGEIIRLAMRKGCPA